MTPIKSPHERIALVKTGDSIMAGRKMAFEAKNWMERNKEAFFEIYGFVKSLQSQEKVGRVRDRVAVFCMERGIKVVDEPYKFANAKWAGIARYFRTKRYSPFRLKEEPVSTSRMISSTVA